MSFNTHAKVLQQPVARISALHLLPPLVNLPVLWGRYFLAAVVMLLTITISAQSPQRPKMKDFIGINTRITDPMKYTTKFQSVREYHLWADGVGYDANNIANCPTGLLKFNPSANQASLDNFDAFYQQLANRVHPSYKWLAPEMRGLQNYNGALMEQKPLCVNGLPGAASTPEGTPYKQLEKFFTIGTVLRNASREDLTSATRYHKSYVAFDNTSTYTCSLKVQFPNAGTSTLRKVTAWIDRNGDGDFADVSEEFFTSGVIAAGGVQTLNGLFTLPIGIPAGDLKKYFRLRIMAISNGVPGPTGSTEENFIWDVALVNSTGGNQVAEYVALEPAAVANKGRIVEVEIKKGATVVYKKTLQNPASLDYNYFNDGNMSLVYKAIAYKFTLDDSPNTKSAQIQTDLNYNGVFLGTDEIKTTNVQPNSTATLSNAWAGGGGIHTGIGIIRVTHRNASTQTTGVWEYPVVVMDENALGTNFSSFLTNTTYSIAITGNTGSATPVNHKVVLPVDQEDPASYTDYVKWLTVLTSRYGAVNVCSTPTSPECVFLQSMVDPTDNGGNATAGLNRLKWLEAGNEPDKFWYDGEFRNQDEAIWQMKAKQYATLLHAAYDGANKSAAFSLGSGKFLGVKNMDPNIKMSMAGISDFRGKYLVDLLVRAESLRATATRKVPFDILNIHHYTSTQTPIGASYVNNANYVWDKEDQFGFTFNSVGACPECADLKGRYNAFYTKLFSTASLSTTVKNELADPTKMEHWITELGYDTNNGSPIQAQIASGTQSYYTTQAQWLVRSLLELAPVQSTYNGNNVVLSKATIFDMRDEGAYAGGPGGQYSPSGGLYAHCGLLTRDFKPKRSWYHVQTLKNALGNYRFNKDINVNGSIAFIGSQPSDPKPRIYDFREDGTNGRHILAIWSPTSNLSNQKTLNLDFNAILSVINEPTNTNLPQNLLNFTIVTSKDFSERGRYKSFATTGTSTARVLNFNATSSYISETPIYVLLNQNINDPDYSTCQMSDLAIAPTCDGGKVTSNLLSGFSGTWKVVYALQSDVTTILAEMGQSTATCATYRDVPFDYLGDSRFKMYAEGWTRVRHLIVNGLAANTSYVLFFFYTDPNGLTAIKPCVLCFSTNSNTPCFINPCLSLTAVADPQSCGTFTDDEKKLLINFVDNACAGTVNSGDPASTATCANYTAADGLYPPLFSSTALWSYCGYHEVTVTFENFVYLDAIKFYHGFGSDDVDILYTCCDCTTPQYLTTFRPYGQVDHWVTIFENMPVLPVKKLHFRKTGYRGASNTTNVEIGKLHFCGEETTSCGIIGLRDGPTKGGIFRKVRAEISDAADVTIAWKPVPYLRDDPSLGVYNVYEAWVAPKQFIGLTQFVSQTPIKVPYYPGLEEVSFSVGPLQPGDYEAMIRIPTPGSGCNFVPSGDSYLQSLLYGLGSQVWVDTLISFTILPKNPNSPAGGPMQLELRKPADMTVYPNPTSGRLVVAWDSPGFHRLDFLTLNGTTVKSVELEPGQTFSEQEMAGLPAGTYLARLSGPGMAPRQKIVVLMR